MRLNFNNIDLIMTAGLESQFIRDKKPQAAFSGRSNVGKSSLINKLSGRKSLARVSSSPGKTITVNYYEIDKTAYIVDLPGYGYARRNEEEKKKWSSLVEAYFTNAEDLKVVLQLVDLKVGPTSDDCMMLDWLEHTEIPYIVVATKCDKLNKTERKKQYDALRGHPLIHPDAPVIAFSSSTGEGKEEVLSELQKYLG